MTQHQSVTKTTRSQCMLRCCAFCACSCCRVSVLVVDVFCFMLVLSALVVLLSVLIQFS